MEPTDVDRGLRHRLRRVLRQIAGQHEQLRELGASLEAALAGDDRTAPRDALVRYRDAIAAHFELEETVFFPALHGLDPAQGEPLAALVRDHVALLGGLRDAASLLDARGRGDFSAAFADWCSRLGAHERREEGLVARVAGDG